MGNWWDEYTLMPEKDAYNATALPGVSGEEYLKRLPPDMGDVIRSLAEYKMDPALLSKKFQHNERMVTGARRFDPDYDPTAYPGKRAMMKEFMAGGPASPAGQMTSGNTAVQHLLTVLEAAEKLKQQPGIFQRIGNAGVPIVSPVATAVQNKLNRGTAAGTALNEYNTAIHHYSEEIAKYYGGAGGTEAQRERALKTFDPNLSIAELRGTGKTEAELINGKVNELQARYQTGMGPKAWLTALKEGGLGDFPVVRQKSAEALKKIQNMHAEVEKKAPAAAPDAEGWITMPGGIRLREKAPAPAAPTAPQP